MKKEIVYFKDSAAKMGIELSDLQLEQFNTYYEMLVEKNKVMNLTAITEFEEVVQKHFLDSISLIKVEKLNQDISIKYDGYIKRQKKQVEQFKKLENKKIPENIDYDQVKSLRIEAVQKLKEFRPVSIGQASRISGVSPADISVLLVYLGGR